MSKTGRQIQVMSRLRNILSEGNKILLYNSFIECYFNYCSIILHFCSKANSLKVEKTRTVLVSATKHKNNVDPR